jgi:uncharacterized phage protein (TIGR01671 family)
MRKLKFRAWDKQDKRWVCNVYEDEPFEIYLNGDYLGLAGSANDWQGSERYELSQFTGLHDIRDKEIYEGDILRFGNITGVCAWDEDQACFWFETDKMANFPLTSSQVIGNIYENPDLLK